MRVVELAIAGVPLLEQLAELVLDLTPAAARVREVGDLWSDLELGPGDVDRFMPMSELRASLPKQHAQARVPADVEVRSATYYPAGGGMGWHTNSRDPGWRLYVPRVVDGPDSGLLSFDRGARVVRQDRGGFAHAFKIEDWRSSWHAVFARTPRLVLGVRITDVRAKAMGLE